MFVLGRMGWVAGKTSLLTGHWGMFERNFLILLFVALEAEVIHSFLLEFRELGAMGVVAG